MAWGREGTHESGHEMAQGRQCGRDGAGQERVHVMVGEGETVQGGEGVHENRHKTVWERWCRVREGACKGSVRWHG